MYSLSRGAYVTFLAAMVVFMYFRTRRAAVVIGALVGFLVLLGVSVIVFALVGRFAKNPVRTYIIISSVFLLISFLPDIGIVSAPFPGAGWAYSITLMIMHVVAGVITVGMLIKLTSKN